MSDYRTELEKALEIEQGKFDEAFRAVREITAALKAIDGVRTGAAVAAPRPTAKGKQKRGQLKRGVLDSIREGSGTVQKIKAYLEARGIATSSASISNSIQKLQAQGLIHKPANAESWRLKETNPRAANSHQNHKGPTDLSEGPLYQNGEAGLRPA